MPTKRTPKARHAQTGPNLSDPLEGLLARKQFCDSVWAQRKLGRVPIPPELHEAFGGEEFLPSLDELRADMQAAAARLRAVQERFRATGSSHDPDAGVADLLAGVDIA